MEFQTVRKTVHPEPLKSAAVLASRKADLRPPTWLTPRGSLRLGPPLTRALGLA